MSYGRDKMAAGQRQRLAIHTALIAIILLGWGLALDRLPSRSIWADEGATTLQARQTDSLTTALRLHKDYHFLHLFLTMGTVRLGASEIVLRFPSAVAATLALPVLYVVGCRLIGRTAGLVGAFLLAISPFAISYAQEARAYALLELLACLSLLLLLMALQEERWSWWVAFVLGTTLLLYTHFFAWFVVGAEVLFALIVLLEVTLKQRQPDPRLAGLAVSLAAIALLYLPLGPATRALWREHGPGQASLQGAGLLPFRLTPQFCLGGLISFGPRSARWGLWLFGLAFASGLGSLALPRKGKALLLAGLWFTVPSLGLTVISSEHCFDYRYLIFLVPIFLLVCGEGVGGAAALLTRAVGWRQPRRAEPWVALGLACLLFVPANRPALQVYRRSEKENWRAIAHFVQAALLPDEAIDVSPQFWASPLLFYKPVLIPHLVGGENGSADPLARAGEQYPGLWYMRHVAPIGNPKGVLTAWVNEHQFDLVVDDNGCGWGISVYYRRSDGLAPARQAELRRLLPDLCVASHLSKSPPEGTARRVGEAAPSASPPTQPDGRRSPDGDF